MAASKLKLVIKQGATFRKRLTWKTGTPLVPVDLTGMTARMQVREELKSAAVLLEMTTENGGIALGGVAGTIDLYLTAVQTAGYTWESGVFDLELVTSPTEITRLVEGTVTVSPEVTR